MGNEAMKKSKVGTTNRPGKIDWFTFLKSVWKPVAGFIGATLLVYNLYKLGLGDPEVITVLLAVGGLAVVAISLLWLAISNRSNARIRRLAIRGLALLVLAAIIASYILIEHRQSQAEKLIVVIAAFDGPEEIYGLQNQIIETLFTEFAADNEVIIRPIDEAITPSQGSDNARRQGLLRQADVVIWGWYRPT